MDIRMSAVWAAPLTAALFMASSVIAADEVIVDDQTFSSWTEYFESDYFRDNGKRCATPPSVSTTDEGVEFRGSGADCSCSSTTIDPQWSDAAIQEINVVVHIITSTSGAGDMSDALVQTQIDVLNEDFRAVAGGPGEEGYDTRIQFKLATVDEFGNPTTGITRTANNTWYSDSGTYYNSLNWDPSRYLNVYTNNAGGGGVLGYVPFLPACSSGSIGAAFDRVVCLWSAFGRPALGGPPYNLGRTVTHEVGHYLGLNHTFNGGCGSASACYTTGDLICDTEQEANPRFSCTGTSCGSPDPIRNYMDYTNDSCMNQFTFEQANRMYCTLSNWRSDLGQGTVATPDGGVTAALHDLKQNSPNPFNPTTRISYELSGLSRVELQILDVSGRVVRNLHKAVESAGRYDVTWDGTNDAGIDLSSGVYFYRLKSDAGEQTRRMILMK
jgi:hypothetical protein